MLWIIYSVITILLMFICMIIDHIDNDIFDGYVNPPIPIAVGLCVFWPFFILFIPLIVLKYIYIGMYKLSGYIADKIKNHVHKNHK